MPRECILTTSALSGVPVADLVTVEQLYGLTGAPYDETVLLAPHVRPDSDSAWAWSRWTWQEHRRTTRKT